MKTFNSGHDFVSHCKHMNLPSHQKTTRKLDKIQSSYFQKMDKQQCRAVFPKRRETNEIISMIASAFFLDIISRLKCRKGQSNRSTVVCSIRRHIRTQEGQGSSNLEDKIPERNQLCREGAPEIFTRVSCFFAKYRMHMCIIKFYKTK